jgi:hypothetical protein
VFVTSDERMKEGKYQRFIITDAEPNDPHLNFMRTRLLLSGDAIIPGSLAVNCVWYWKGSDTVTTKAHTHDCDEIIAFIGTNPDDPRDLAGEVEIWLGDEKYILRNSCLVFAPKGFIHCPLIIRQADRPIFHFTAKVQAGAHLIRIDTEAVQ